MRSLGMSLTSRYRPAGTYTGPSAHRQPSSNRSTRSSPWQSRNRSSRTSSSVGMVVITTRTVSRPQVGLLTSWADVHPGRGSGRRSSRLLRGPAPRTIRATDRAQMSGGRGAAAVDHAEDDEDEHHARGHERDDRGNPGDAA